MEMTDSASIAFALALYPPALRRDTLFLYGQDCAARGMRLKAVALCGNEQHEADDEHRCERKGGGARR